MSVVALGRRTGETPDRSGAELTKLAVVLGRDAADRLSPWGARSIVH